MAKLIKPPKTKVEFDPPASLVKFSIICLFNSCPIVPIKTIKRAQSGPALPKIEEKAIRFDNAHLKPAVMVAK